MKKITQSIFYMLSAVMLLTMFACEKEEEVLKFTETGASFPSVLYQSRFVLTYAKGASIPLEAKFVSRDPIKEVILKRIVLGATAATNDTSIVLTRPYQSAFSTLKKADTVVFDYKVPETIASRVRVTLRTEVVTEKNLRSGTNMTFTVQ